MNKRECGSGNVAKMCLCLSMMLLLLSSFPENSSVSALPTGEKTEGARRSGVRMMMDAKRVGYVYRSRSGRGPVMVAETKP
ncbi:hypothetical protein ISN45_Aa02g024590 [Arabidopsis thaliana x Arabidopsis arenosa]|uniref:Transmembrane protein n=1 Tax=Arabidopsis thaliana x Arabidopsis arenosa TaxID=1240361 RepID=A0A8T2BIJ5_9BRAS|nr:hypothetical protein ISN45_Aa02g024590 [Arabidopsis thaliana x Arabidopsis arenosa]